jgi:hypothetical protein
VLPHLLAVLLTKPNDVLKPRRCHISPLRHCGSLTRWVRRCLARLSRTPCDTARATAEPRALNYRHTRTLRQTQSRLTERDDGPQAGRVHARYTRHVDTCPRNSIDNASKNKDIDGRIGSKSEHKILMCSSRVDLRPRASWLHTCSHTRSHFGMSAQTSADMPDVWYQLPGSWTQDATGNARILMGLLVCALS